MNKKLVRIYLTAQGNVLYDFTRAEQKFLGNSDMVYMDIKITKENINTLKELVKNMYNKI